MKAFLNNYRQSPRKTRLVADAIRGKTVFNAIAQLDVMNKRAAGPMQKLVRSAVANAKQNFNKEGEVLFVKEIQVNEGVVLKRSQPAWRGTAHPIKKRRSQVMIVLAEQKGAETKTKEVKKEVKAVKVAKEKKVSTPKVVKEKKAIKK
jgi:large subunit ribosomal protein L22